MRRRSTLAFAAPLVAFALAAQAGDRAIDGAGRQAVIEEALRHLEREYVFPEVAARMDTHVRARAAEGAYEGETTAPGFARTLTADLQSVSRDKHLRVTPRRPSTGRARFEAPAHQGFARKEVLAGNIGYLEVSTFLGRGGAFARAAAEAMEALASADALVIDLRRNGGGSPESVAVLSSYLFERRVHLNTLVWRARAEGQEFWTRDTVAGRRFGESKPVYVLISSSTFSGAEEFAYNLQALKRATIVGETSGGGANPGDLRELPEGLAMFVPTGRALNPVTGTNWEGVGVKPDVAVPADQALDRALELARAATARATAS